LLAVTTGLIEILCNVKEKFAHEVDVKLFKREREKQSGGCGVMPRKQSRNTKWIQAAQFLVSSAVSNTIARIANKTILTFFEASFRYRIRGVFTRYTTNEKKN